MHTRHHTSPAGRPGRRRPWRPAVPALLLLTLLEGAGAVQAQQSPSQQSPSQQSPSQQSLSQKSLSQKSLSEQSLSTQSQSTQSLRSRASDRPSRPLQGFGAAELAQSPGNPKALPIEPSAGGGMRQQLNQLSPSQQQQLFSQQKQLQLRFLRDRRQLLQAGEGCLTAATNLDQLRNCMREERQANMELRRRHMQEMRAMLQGFGIKLLDRPAKGGRWGGGAGGLGQPEGPGVLAPGRDPAASPSEGVARWQWAGSSEGAGASQGTSG